MQISINVLEKQRPMLNLQFQYYGTFFLQDTELFLIPDKTTVNFLKQNSWWLRQHG